MSRSGCSLVAEVGLDAGLLFVAAGVLLYLVYAVVRRARRRGVMRGLVEAELGEPVVRRRDKGALASFDPGPSDRFGSFRLDDATWDDLDLDAVFAAVDRTRTSPGERVLATLLRRPLADVGRVEDRIAAVAAVDAEARGRTEVEIELRLLGRSRTGATVSLLWEPLPARPADVSVYTVLGFLPIALALGMRLVPVLALVLIANIALNMYLHYGLFGRIGPDGAGIPYLLSMVRAGTRLGKLRARAGSAFDAALADCARLARELRPLLRHGRMIAFGYTAAAGDLIEQVSEYLRILFLSDVRGYFGVLHDLERLAPSARELYLVVGQLDATLSISSWRRSLSTWCTPALRAGPAGIELEDGVHPLLSDPVPNSIVLRDRNALVTGSNMAGKSTFLRMVGLSALLGQSLATCPARRYAAVPLRVVSSIRHRDELADGRSFYLAEAERLFEVVRLADRPEPLLVLLDEPLRGTNSVERIAACHEILRHLEVRHVLVIVATHEIRLAELLADTWRPLHFTDYVTAEGLRFPYEIREGIARTRNAIRLLADVGYPPALVEAADRLAETLSAPDDPESDRLPGSVARS